MNCPSCHGTGWYWKRQFGVKELQTNILRDFIIPCTAPGCFNGQISSSEGENRDEAASVT